MTSFKSLPAMLCAASTIALAPAAAQVPLPVPTQAIAGAVLDVQADGKVTRVPDVALVSAGVVTQAATAADASRANAERMSAVLAALRAARVAERDIQTATVQLQPRYQYGENQPPVITGYQATNSVRIRFRDIARSGAIIDALVSAGANQVEGPALMVDEPESALDEARGAAIATARARAELYARAAGLSVARILSISESGNAPPPVPMYRMAMARSADAAAETAIVPGEQELSVSVSVRFELR